MADFSFPIMVNVGTLMEGVLMATVSLAEVSLFVGFYNTDEGWTEAGAAERTVQTLALRLSVMLGGPRTDAELKDERP